MSWVRTAVRYGYAPFMMFGLIGAGYVVVAYDHSYAWLGAILATALVAAFAAEHVSPWHSEWNEPHGDDTANLFHLVVYEFSNVTGVLLIPFITWLFPFQGLWPAEWPILAQFLLAFVIADASFMGVHYLSHRTPLLWRLHAVHHGPSRLYGFNGIIRHPLHQSIDMIIGTAPLVIMGMPVPVAILLGLAISITLIVQHSNVSYILGPLEKHLAIGKIHHLHHVNWGPEGDCNFGLFFTHWDRLFGTFKPEPPRPIRAGDIGVDELPNFPKSFWEQLILPFVYEPGKGEPARYRRTGEPRHTGKLHPAE